MGNTVILERFDFRRYVLEDSDLYGIWQDGAGPRFGLDGENYAGDGRKSAAASSRPYGCRFKIWPPK